MSRKLVVCLDGTGNEIEKKESNVLRLYKCLNQTDNQVVYYRTGVGTLNTKRITKGLFSKPYLIAGMVFGAGLERNVIEAYKFLCENYRDGDRLYFFGYSRGAYTARVLAGFINEFGLVPANETHLIGPVFRTYRKLKKSDAREKYAPLRMFEGVFHVKHPSIRMLGLWDTVSSMLKFRLKLGTFVEYGTHASVDVNPSVKSVRHVLSIDETRRFFRHQLWEMGQKYHGTRFKTKKNPPNQDVKQRWFAGTHADVAGGVPEAEAGLAKLTMAWMRKELDDLGADALDFRETTYNRYVLAKQDKVTKKMKLEISKPDATTPLHSKFWHGWFVAEALPRLRSRSRWPQQRGIGPYHVPWGQYRYIESDADIDPSVWDRKSHAESKYDPKNLRNFTPPKLKP